MPPKVADASTRGTAVRGAARGSSRAVTRVIGFDPMGNKVTDQRVESKQLLEDPFTDIPGYGETIRTPPYMLEQFVMLAEQIPVHGSCIRQKVLDVVADGPMWVPDNPDLLPKNSYPQAKEIEQWWQSLTDEFTMLEILQSWWDDYEVTGWGMMEIARDNKGIVRQLFYVPSHTIRATADGSRFAQIRHGRVVWFKKWGVPGDIYWRTGRPCPPNTPVELKANELLPLRRPTRRSTWYGIPDYVPSVGYMTLALAARDWNILFFENYREPRHLIVVTGMEEDVEKVLDDLEESLRAQANEPHRNLLLPIPGDAKVTIEKLSVPGTDADFLKMIEKADSEIMMSHRVPPDRIGVSHVSGLVGGSTSQLIQTINQIYKEGVVQKGQGLLEDRIDRFVRVEFARFKNISPDEVKFHASFAELDIEDAQASAGIVNDLIRNAVITLNEGRKRIGEVPLEKFTDPETKIDYTLPEYLKSIGVSSPSHTGIQFLSPSLLNVDGTFSEEPNPEVVGDGTEEGQLKAPAKGEVPLPPQLNGKNGQHPQLNPPGKNGASSNGSGRAPEPVQKTFNDLYRVLPSAIEIAQLTEAVGDLRQVADRLLTARR